MCPAVVPVLIDVYMQLPVFDHPRAAAWATPHLLRAPQRCISHACTGCRGLGSNTKRFQNDGLHALGTRPHEHGRNVCCWCHRLDEHADEPEGSPRFLRCRWRGSVDHGDMAIACIAPTVLQSRSRYERLALGALLYTKQACPSTINMAADVHTNSQHLCVCAHK